MAARQRMTFEARVQVVLDPIERADLKHGMEVYYTSPRVLEPMGPWTIDKGMLETCLINPSNKLRRNIDAWPNVEFWIVVKGMV